MATIDEVYALLQTVESKIDAQDIEIATIKSDIATIKSDVEITKNMTNLIPAVL